MENARQIDQWSDSSPQESSKDLFVSQRLRNSSLVIFFLLGLLALDQLVLRVGNRMIASPYWGDSLESRIAVGGKWDLLILGTCRAWSVRTPLLKEILGKEILNAGVRTAKIPTMNFNFKMANEYGQPKNVLLFVDHFVMEVLPGLARKELDMLSLWSSYLKSQQWGALLKKAESGPFENLRNFSGLLKFKTRGSTVARSYLRYVRDTPVPNVVGQTGTDNFDVFKYGDIRNSLGNLQSRQRQETTYTKYALDWLEELILEIQQQGIRPIIVLPPLHQMSSTPRVKQTLIGDMSKLADKHSVPFLNYLTPGNHWSSDHILWAAPEHMNEKGSIKFTETLGQDLKKLFNDI